MELELENGKEVIDARGIVYGPPRKSICIFFGLTPSSMGDKIRAYSAACVFVKVIENAKIFTSVKEGEMIKVEAIKLTKYLSQNWNTSFCKERKDNHSLMLASPPISSV